MPELNQVELKESSLLKQKIIGMFEQVQQMFQADFDGFIKNDIDILKQVPAAELKVTKIYNNLTTKAVEVSKQKISNEAKQHVGDLVDIICSVERIGDCCVDLAERIEYKIVERLLFSEAAVQEYQDLHSKVNQIISDVIDAMKASNQELPKQIVESKTNINRLVDTYRANHIERSARGICDEWAKVRYLDMLDFTKEAAEHCIEIAEKLMVR
ncbi:PhoU domain-containing protein [Candidatus Omnitrophota bacterium]